MKSLHVDKFNHDEWATSYDRDVSDETQPIREGYDQVLNWVIQEAHIGQDASVLELGSGTGNLTKRVKACRKIVCVDISTAMELLAAPKTSHLRKEFITSDLLEVFDRDIGIFDCVISTYAIHHLTEQEKWILFQKVWDCLNENGFAVFGDLMFENQKTRVEKIHDYRDCGEEEVVSGIDEEFFWDIETSIRKLNEIGFMTRIKRFSDLSFGISAMKSNNPDKALRERA